MAEDTDTGLLREIDEELRKDRLTQIWDQYGKLIIAGVVLIIASVAGFKGWQSYDLSQRESQGHQFIAAENAVTSGDLESAISQFSNLADTGSSGYQVLARFRVATLLSQSGDTAAAADAFNAIAADSSTPSEYRDLATILAALNTVDKIEDTTTLLSSLQPVTENQNPWRHAAREVYTLALIKAGAIDEAKEELNLLVSDTSAPQSTRERAQELLATLGDS